MPSGNGSANPKVVKIVRLRIISLGSDCVDPAACVFLDVCLFGPRLGVEPVPAIDSGTNILLRLNIGRPISFRPSPHLCDVVVISSGALADANNPKVSHAPPFLDFRRYSHGPGGAT